MKYLFILTAFFLICFSGQSQIAFPQDNSEIISFKLKNNSSQSVQIIIPSGTSTNLSVNSELSVKLKVGQIIYCKRNGNKTELLTVDKTIKPNDVIEIAKLLTDKNL